MNRGKPLLTSAVYSKVCLYNCHAFAYLPLVGLFVKNNKKNLGELYPGNPAAIKVTSLNFEFWI
jgi:hypothetical protein